MTELVIKPISISIVHIEDEFFEFTFLASNIQTGLEDYLEGLTGELPVILPKVVDQLDSETKELAGQIIELTCEDHNITVKYVFIKDKLLTESHSAELLTRSLFVLDVLRPNDNDGMVLVSSVQESIDSVRQYCQATDEIILFTAFPDAVENKLLSTDIEVFDKVDPQSFIDKLMEVIFEEQDDV